ncbi:hypothetical protein SAMN04488096_104291 [Mesonia phycicola]|uniref:Uncharacterized protein n=1 Tax=Mesonia phycicola TaxID=579105 RepID=A0A1M6E132_9FLAO|nr:hypothetical protein [Mesonia phycicola]SHI79113.1 hypothetical protein SAMN04488096_104291 [Mesonia phycicola]
MIERLLLKHLTKKGKIAYFVGVILLLVLLGYFMLEVQNYSLDDDRITIVLAMIVVNLLWAGVCFLCWKKPKEEVLKS